MKKINNYLFLLTVLLFAGQILAQSTTNVVELNRMSVEFEKIWQEKSARVVEYSLTHNVPISFESDEGVYYQMVDVIDGRPEYYRTDNLGAAATTRADELWVGGNSGLELTGEGYNQVGVWDAGNVRTSHQEFTDQGPSRVIVQDGAHATHYHATHVAGTMVAGGVSNNAKGMLYGGVLKSWQWSQDESEMAAAAANGLEISNHSYGYARGWDYSNGNWTWKGVPSISPDEDYKFGFYDSGSRQWDQIAYNAPYYLIVKSAGNDRGEGPGNAGNGEPEKDGGDDGYDCISPRGIAKNLMTVGAVTEVLDYSGPGSVSMSSFSCWGPADDSRIKPDIVGKGVDVFSTSDGSNTAYQTLQGTSMSSPNVSGSMALLQHHYQETHNDEVMRASTLKGLVLHSADEAGDHEGPDYRFGWGLMNAERAGLIISEDVGQNVIDEITLGNGDTYTRDINVPEGGDVRVTICWTDVPGSPTSPQLNPSTTMLVNDLDIEIDDPDNITHYPYSLDRDDPSAAATTLMKNHVDNVEMIYLQDIDGGTYTITVDHAGTLSGGSQVFSLIISGIEEYTILPECSDVLETPQDGGTDAFINQLVSWRPALYASSYDVYFGTDGGGSTTPTNIFNGDNFMTNEFSTLLETSTTYYVQIAPRNNVGVNDACSQIWSFTTMDAIDVYPYLIDMEDVTTPELPELWQSTDYTNATWFSSNLISHSGSKSMACYDPTEFVQIDYDNWFISPPFSVAVGNEYRISYFYRPLIGGNSESMTLYWGNTPFVEDLTNVVYADNDFSSDWVEALALFVPDESGNIFLGFHMNSTQGYGSFLDDVKITDWGTVDVGNKLENDKVKIYGYSGNVTIEASDVWNGADIMITNMLGQKIYQGRLIGKTNIPISNNSQSGLYIVSLNKSGNLITKKLFMR